METNIFDQYIAKTHLTRIALKAFRHSLYAFGTGAGLALFFGIVNEFIVAGTPVTFINILALFGGMVLSGMMVGVAIFFLSSFIQYLAGK